MARSVEGEPPELIRLGCGVAPGRAPTVEGCRGLPVHSVFRRNFSTPQTTCSLLPVTAACGVEKLEEPIADPETAHNNPRQSEVTFVTTHIGPAPLREPAQRGGFFYSGASEVSTQPSL